MAGFSIGIITIDFNYVKLPGNVANATTFSFPVVYEDIVLEIEDLFNGEEKLLDMVIEAAKKLEKKGVRAIVGACGYFNHFQEQVRDAVAVPVYLSSVLQIPLIKMGLKPDQKIAVLVADGEGANASISDCIVKEIGSLESFAPIRYNKPYLDNGRLKADLIAVVQELRANHPEIGAILLECSDLPPYAAALHRATGLPVFDFTTLINWVHSAVVRREFYGYM
ncbi:aspartate/glutamate racemase family protein [Streptococcus sp. A22]|uniref:aspartate/glutamate racemase family protein n=1 Tax=Streptococcus sp. A22 TaxID=3373126 RepID=UPI00374CD3F3